MILTQVARLCLAISTAIRERAWGYFLYLSASVVISGHGSITTVEFLSIYIGNSYFDGLLLF